MRPVLLALFLTLSLIVGPPITVGRAGETAHSAGRFSIWVPDSWTVQAQGDRLIAHNPNDNIQLVVGPIADKDADLTDEDVRDFVDEELDGMAIAADQMTTHAGRPARQLQGTGDDEDEDVVFQAVAIDPAPGLPVITALLYGETGPMARPEVQQMVARILASFRPL